MVRMTRFIASWGRSLFESNRNILKAVYCTFITFLKLRGVLDNKLSDVLANENSNINGITLMKRERTWMGPGLKSSASRRNSLSRNSVGYRRLSSDRNGDVRYLDI